MKSAFLTILLLLGSAAGTLAQQRGGTTATASRSGEVSIRTTGGSVRVVGWSRAEVAVRTEDEGRDRVKVTSRGGQTAVRAGDGSGNLEVRVPSGSRVEVSTRSGDVEVSGVDGAVDLQSMSGDFRIVGRPRQVAVEGISGDVEMVGTTESLRVRTVSGDVSVPRASGFVELSTVSGDLEVRSHALRSGTMRNSSGTIRFMGSLPRDGSLRLENSSGEIELRVPAGLSADFDLTALGNGRIENQLGPEPQRSGPRSRVSSVRFSSGCNCGGAEITARTVSGVIRLRRM